MLWQNYFNGVNSFLEKSQYEHKCYSYHMKWMNEKKSIFSKDFGVFTGPGSQIKFHKCKVQFLLC